MKQQYKIDKPINLILNGAGYHKNKLVVKAAIKLGIKRHYLPPESFYLNPIEQLWKVMHEYGKNNKYFVTSGKV
ncbi:MAG: transposase [Psychromonas sp.]|nr:transposase [Psychromonas sp.]